MKRLLVRQCLGLAVGLGLFGGCAKPSAQTDQPRAVVAPPTSGVAVMDAPVVTPAQFTPAPAPQAAAAPAPVPPPTNSTSAIAVAPPESQDTNGPAIEQTIAPALPANMSPGVDELVRLAQGGVSEEVMIAYIEKYPGQFNASADQIVYLNDLGVSSTVVTTMLKHDGVTAPAASAEQPGPTQQVSNLPEGVSMPAPAATAPAAPAPVYAEGDASAQVVTPPATPAPSTDVAYFYDSLSPYGSWMYVSGYGWCWQPTVALSTSDWRPYSQSGRWYWSDSGWYWHSDYSWGWAPFHYGRWYSHPHRGWLWTPGSVWGPAWVSWRYSDGYCGWAPLPPEAYWVPGVGFTYYGRHVSIGFDFGLSWHHYGFVPIGRFHDPYPHRHFVHRHNQVNIYRDTRVVNHYVPHSRGLVNRGVGRETIARHTQGDVRQVRIESTRLAGPAGRINRLENRGREVVAYRAELPNTPPVKPAVVQSRMAQDARQQQRIARVDTTPGVVNTAPRPARSATANGGNRTPTAAPTPVQRRAETGAERSNERVGRAGNAAPSRVEQPQTPQPRVTAPRQSEPRATAPSRIEPRPSAPAPERPSRIERAPRSEVPAVRQRAESPVQRSAPQRVYAEPRSPSVAAPSTVTPRATPRPAQPGASPRALERSPVFAAPRPSAPAAPAAPSYSAPRVAPAQRSAPAPSYNAPRGGGGGSVAAPRAERGGGGGGGGNARGGGGGASRGDVAGRGDRNR